MTSALTDLVLALYKGILCCQTDLFYFAWEFFTFRDVSNLMILSFEL